MNHYRGYGLRIRSDLELPELLTCAAGARVDVDIRFGPVAGPMPSTDSPRLVRFDANGGYFAWPHIGRFQVSREGLVTVDPLTDDGRSLRFALLGPVLAGVLQLHGVPLLHGSAVARGREAVLFVGRKGAGKSSIAGAFAACGCEILNDDVLPLLRQSSGMRLRAGFPALKLSPAARDILLPDWPAIDGETLNSNHKIVVLDPSQVSGDFPITAVIVLDPEAPIDPIALSPPEALQELLQHGYALKFGHDALDNGQGEGLFETCTRLAQTSQVIRVGRPDGISQLRAFADLLLSAI